jgi:rhodanese-related sulfurtransferase
MIVRIAAAALAAGWAGAAQAAPIDDLKSQCYVGTEPPAASGSMPARIPGVITVSPREAKCALDKVPQVLVLAPMRDLEQLPNAVPLPLLASAKLDGDNLAKAQAAMTELTAGDKSRPILVYCHHASCGYSVEASKHLAAWGYRNILWMREGLSGWLAAKYPLTPIDKIRAPLGEPSYTMWIKPAGDTTFGCFGEKKLEVCDRKVHALTKIFTAPDLPADQRDLVAGQLFNAAAVRAEVIRENKDYGGPAKAFPEAELAYKALKQYAAQKGRQGVLAEHAKVVREYAVNAIETNRPQLAEQVLKEVRADAAAGFKRLASVRGNEAERKAVQGAMVAMEHLERDVADFAIEKAGTWYSEDRRAEAAPYRKLAVDAIDRAILWIERNGAEGIGHQMDLAPEYRLNDVLVKKGELLLQDGDKPGAKKAFGLATGICGLKDEDERFNNYERACETAQLKYFLLTPEFERWSAEQARKEYEFYLSLLKD